MIRVTRLDRREIALNCELIESIEAQPDTTIRLVTGQTRVVRESMDEVLERVRDWRASVLERAGLPGVLAHAPILRASAGIADDDRADLEVPA